MPRPKATTKAASKATELNGGTRKAVENGDDIGGTEVIAGTNDNDIEVPTISPKATMKGRGRGKKETVEKTKKGTTPSEIIPEDEKKSEIEVSAAAPKGRGKKVQPAAIKVIEPTPEKPAAKGRKKIDTVLATVTEVSPKISVDEGKSNSNLKKRGRKAAATAVEAIETQNNGVAEDDVEVAAASTVAGKGRKKREPVAKQPEVSAVTPIVASKEEKAVPPKKRASNKKIKDVEAADMIEENLALEEDDAPVVSSNVNKIEKQAKAEKPTKEKANAKSKKKNIEENAEEITIKKVAAVRGNKRNQKTGKTETENNELDVEQDAELEQLSKASPMKKAKPDLEEIKPVTKMRGRGGKKQIDQEVTVEEAKAPLVDKKKPAQRGKKRVAAEPSVTAEDGDDDLDGAKPAKSKKAAPLNDIVSEYNKIDFNLASEKSYNLKISSWNVAGLRSWLKKDGLKFLEYEEPDIFCLQETKCTTDQLPEEAARIPGYHPYWLCMPGGHAGVAIYSKIMPIHVEYGIGNKEFDDTGRIITAEYEKFFLICVYVPNSGRKLVNLDPRMRWEKLFQAYVEKLNARKPIVICGDMNVSHQEIDLANPKTNTRNAGFTKEEREKMTELLALGYVDTFRHLYPERTGAYTFWTYMGNARSRNVGWRLDYFLVSERFIKRVVDNCIRTQCKGSDHCPITLFLNL